MTDGRSSADATSSPVPKFDIPKLHSLPSEQQELYILNYITNLAKFIDHLEPSVIDSEQLSLKSVLLQITTLTNPAPSRVIRNNVGRCFAKIFAKGNRKSLYETINELCATITNGKGNKDLKAKHASVTCLGFIFQSAGDSAISLSGFAVSAILRSSKASQDYIGFHGTCFRSLAKIIQGVGQSIDESVAREVFKRARKAVLNDKAYLVQTCACYCIGDLIRHTSYFENLSDFEKIQAAVWRALDSPSSQVRNVAARTFASCLVKSYVENPIQANVAKAKKIRKVTKRQGKGEIEDDEYENSDSAAAEQIPNTLLQFGCKDILSQLSLHYLHNTTTNRARIGMISCFTTIFKELGPQVIESHYGEIASHLLVELPLQVATKSTRHRQLLTRNCVALLLENVVGRQLLSEDGQIAAVRYLVSDIIKDYPQALNERAEPSKMTLVCSLSAIASLLQLLGCAAYPLAGSCQDGLIALLQHPSYTVQIYASVCLKSLVWACPHLIVPVVTICLNSIKREFGQPNPTRQSTERCVGFANGLSAVMSIANLYPIYGSLDVYSRVFNFATALLKTSSSSDLRTSSIQIQTAWILIGGLMSLGPQFVKVQLPQLLLLWKNALPKPYDRDTAHQDTLEISFLAHLRHCALGCVYAFLEYNNKILTVDIVKRLATMLQNTVEFLHDSPEGRHSVDHSQRLLSNIQYSDLKLMVRRRVIQCFCRLILSSSASSNEVKMQSSLLPFAISTFADPENFIPSTLSTAIAGSAGSFESLWELSDNLAYGLTSLLKGCSVQNLPGEPSGLENGSLTGPHDHEAVDDLLSSPIYRGKEHDPVLLYIDGIFRERKDSPPLTTEVVDLAIYLFGLSIPMQAPQIQESILEQISSYMLHPLLQKAPARKAAITVNIAVAMLVSLRAAMKIVNAGGTAFSTSAVGKSFQNILHLLIVDADVNVRQVASQALGLLCYIKGTSFITSEINYLVESIIANREPIVRAGCAGSLGSIFSRLGGMAAGYHLKDILGILMSLSNDPHPTVHYWAIDSISKVAEAAGLTFSSHVSVLLGMAARLYLSDTHNEETNSLASSNLECDLPCTTALAHMIDSLIHVLGPDLQDMSKVQEMILMLLQEFQEESEPETEIGAVKSYNHIALYAISLVNFPWYVRRLQHWLRSDNSRARDIAIGGLYDLTKRNVQDVFSAAEAGFEDSLWMVLNDEPDNQMIRSIIKNSLEDIASNNPTQWVDNCQKVLAMTVMHRKDPSGNPDRSTSKTVDLEDEEVAGFAVSSNTEKEESPDFKAKQLLRWQVRTFAMGMLNDLLASFTDNSAKSEALILRQRLQDKVGEIIRLAFSASTSGNIALRLCGLNTINYVLTLYGRTPDPDFPDSTLLEQYQAQISSALTPAFAADSSPELAAEAIRVCATFIATGIVTDVERMGRIPKLLTSALNTFTDTDQMENVAIGDLRDLSPNARIIVKIAIFTAWAKLQIASSSLPDLVNLMKPHLYSLAPSWLELLRDYARLRFEPDITASSIGLPLDDLDQIYSALNRSILLQFYQNMWLQLVDAITSLIEEDSEFIFQALDGQKKIEEKSSSARKPSEINYRDEPVAFFFLLFGIVFEALTQKPKNDNAAHKESILELLQALQRILRPAVSGRSIYQEAIFSETLDVLGRLVFTSPSNTKVTIVKIAKNLVLNHPSAIGGQSELANDDKLSDDIDQLFQATRIIVLALDGVLLGLGEGKASHLSKTDSSLSDEDTKLVLFSISALVDVAEVYPSVIKKDLHACIMHIFVLIFGTPTCQADVVPQGLPIFKSFLQTVAALPKDQTGPHFQSLLNQLSHVMRVAQRREFASALQCEKNAMLGLTIILTCASSLLDTGLSIVTKIIDDFVDCLGHGPTTKVAAGCCRSLLIQQQGRDEFTEEIALLLIPKLFDFFLHPPDVDGLSETVKVVGQILCSFVSTLQTETRKQTATALIMPVLLSKAAAATEGTASYPEISQRLLELANTSPTSFRSIVAALDTDSKTILEKVLLQGREHQNLQSKAQAAGRLDGQEPTIALKTDFAI